MEDPPAVTVLFWCMSCQGVDIVLHGHVGGRSQVWDLFFNADEVREMMTHKVQEESLRTYLFSYSSVYDSLSLYKLSDMFELDKPTVHSVISKMIINEELMVKYFIFAWWKPVLVNLHIVQMKSSFLA